MSVLHRFTYTVPSRVLRLFCSQGIELNLQIAKPRVQKTL